MRELSLNVLDIVQNSVAANSSLIEVCLNESTKDKALTIKITDNGKGMTEKQLEAVRDPFFTTRTTRKVGMGIPLFKMAAEMTGGSLSIESQVGKGTVVTAFFKTDHVDFIPIGDMTSTMVMLITMNTQIDFIYERSLDEKSFAVDTRKLKEILQGVPLNEPSVSAWIKDFIDENTKELTEV